MAARRHQDAPVTTLRERRGARLLVGWIGVLALVLAACGGDDDEAPGDGQGVDIDDELADDPVEDDDVDDADDPDTDEGDEATEEDDDPVDGEDADEDTDAADEDADAADGDEDATGDDEGDDGEENDDTAAHRAPEEAAPDCDAIEGAEPGATIAFPSAEGEGWQEAGVSPATVEVVGCSNTFEANVQYEAYHGEDAEPTVEGHTMGGTMGDWGEFRFEETFWTPGEWRIVVFEMDAESGDRLEYDEQTFVVDEG